MTAQFYVENEGIKELVKTITININQNAVSSISEQMFNDELYAANRAEMRKDEAKLSEIESIDNCFPEIDYRVYQSITEGTIPQQEKKLAPLYN